MDTQVKFEIRKAVPLPMKASGGRPGHSKYPFGDMEISDSILVGPDHKTAVRSALTAFRKRNKDKQFATRVVGDGIGIWRVG